MRKTLFAGLLTAAILTLTLSGCKNPAATGGEDKGSTPIVKEAFFLASDVSEGTTLGSARASALTEINKNTNCYLAFVVKDIDKDITNVQISPYSDFDDWVGWVWKTPVNKEEFFTTGEVAFEHLDTSTISYMTGTNKTIYVRAIDSKGNISTLYSITGLSINQ